MSVINKREVHVWEGGGGGRGGFQRANYKILYVQTCVY